MMSASGCDPKDLPDGPHPGHRRRRSAGPPVRGHRRSCPGHRPRQVPALVNAHRCPLRSGSRPSALREWLRVEPSAAIADLQDPSHAGHRVPFRPTLEALVVADHDQDVRRLAAACHMAVGVGVVGRQHRDRLAACRGPAPWPAPVGPAPCPWRMDPEVPMRLDPGHGRQHDPAAMVVDGAHLALDAMASISRVTAFRGVDADADPLRSRWHGCGAPGSRGPRRARSSPSPPMATSGVLPPGQGRSLEEPPDGRVHRRQVGSGRVVCTGRDCICPAPDSVIGSRPTSAARSRTRKRPDEPQRARCLVRWSKLPRPRSGPLRGPSGQEER